MKDMLSKLIEFENADAGKVPSVTPPEALPPLGNSHLLRRPVRLGLRR